MQEMWVWSLGLEDPLEEEMATHSSILAGKISWTEEPGKLPSQRVRHSEQLSTHAHTHAPAENYMNESIILHTLKMFLFAKFDVYF